MNIASGLVFANGIETNFARFNFQKVYILFGSVVNVLNYRTIIFQTRYKKHFKTKLMYSP